MDYTFASVIVADSDKATAQAEMGEGLFTCPLSASGAAPATHWLSSGPFNNEEMNTIVNVAKWSKKVYFGGDWEAAIANEGLQKVVESTDAV